MTACPQKTDRSPGRFFFVCAVAVVLSLGAFPALSALAAITTAATASTVSADAGAQPVLAGAALDAFVRAADARCPERRLRLITPGDLDWAQEGYIASLPANARAELAAANHGAQRCADSPGGLSCPTSATLEALQAVERMPAFAAYACGHGATATRSATRVFADTCIEPESGDVAGHVVALSAGSTAPTLTFAWSEGSLVAPVAAQVDHQPGKRRLNFTLQAPPGTFTFRGRLAAHRLTGRLTSPWDAAARAVTLVERPAALAYQPTAACAKPER